MTTNGIGLIMSFLFIFLLIGASTVLSKKGLLSNEGSRKFIHIGVSNWWIIAMYYFDSRLWASIVPITFIVLNYISYKFNLVKAMERDGGKKDLGTVYFPISLLVLVLISFSNYSEPYVGALGILVMGYGDGFAAILGKKFGKRKFLIFGNEKSIAGSVSMFVFSFIASFIVLYFYSPENLLLKSMVIASFSTVVEGISPAGLDNLTVPILASLLYQLIYF